MKRLFSVILIFSLGILSSMAFNHPGLLHSKSALKRIKTLVKDRNEVALGSYAKLSGDPKAQYTYVMGGPFDVMARDGRYGKRKKPSEDDCNAAYYNALMWTITGDKRHADKAMEIVRSYAKTLTAIEGHDAPLCAALQGFIMINACEILRYTCKDWTKEDGRLTEKMFRKVFMSVLDEFRDKSPYANGNWGGAANKMRMATAVYCNDKQMYEEAVNYYYNGNDNGSLPNYIAESGQCQESGRDQAHVMLGLGQLAETCEVAWNQGTDLYGALENRLMVGYEYTSKANLRMEVPFVTWKDLTGKYCNWRVLSESQIGNWRAVFEMPYNHYVGRKHLQMPYTSMALGHYIRPEGAGFTCDDPGFGSLLFYQYTDVDKTTKVPDPLVYTYREVREYDVATEPVIQLKGISHLKLLRHLDCWDEFWDLEPVRLKDGVYEYEPAGTLSRNGIPFRIGKIRTTFVSE